jgi:hypothetical protein
MLGEFLSEAPAVKSEISMEFERCITDHLLKGTTEL